MEAPLSQLKIRDFRCIANAELEFSSGINLILGKNAQGKTSLLEAICVLQRLQSPRTHRLASCIRNSTHGFYLDGLVQNTRLQFYYGHKKRKLALNTVEQSNGKEYLEVGRVVVIFNDDINLIQGGADKRRRLLDFLAAQLYPHYRQSLKHFNDALRSRNRILKISNGRDFRQIAAFNRPLIHAGNIVMECRREVIRSWAGDVQKAYLDIAKDEDIHVELGYIPGVLGDFAKELETSREDEIRLRQTLVGPHRDDLLIRLNNQPASEFASEGQQRSLALALRLGQLTLLRRVLPFSPILLMDDIFGELDRTRRKALLQRVPSDIQTFITTTDKSWMPQEFPMTIFQAHEGRFSRIHL